VFGYAYDEIAAIVDKSEDNCRQIAVRARRQVETKKPRFEASRNKRAELSRRFVDAVATGDTAGLIGLLAADVFAYTDGGGQARAVTDPVYGREDVARLFFPARRLAVSPVEVNGQPGALLLDRTGRPVVVVSLDIADEVVQTVRASVTPTSCVISLGRSKPE